MTVGRIFLSIATLALAAGAHAHSIPRRSVAQLYAESNTVVELRVVSKVRQGGQEFEVIRTFRGNAQPGQNLLVRARSPIPGTLNDYLPVLAPTRTGFAFLTCESSPNRIQTCELVWPGAFLFAVPQDSMRLYLHTYKFNVTPQMYIPPQRTDRGIPIDRLALIERLKACSRADGCPERKTYDLFTLHQRNWPPPPKTKCPPKAPIRCGDSRPTVIQ